MVVLLNRGRLLPLLVLTYLMFGCSFSNTQNKTIFKSASLQDSLNAFINRVDSIPNSQGCPTIIYVTLYEMDGIAHTDFDADLGWQTWPLKDTNATKLFCSGRYLGRLLFITGNPRYEHLVHSGNLVMSNADKDFLCRKSEHMLDENVYINDYHQEFILSKKGAIIKKIK